MKINKGIKVIIVAIVTMLVLLSFANLCEATSKDVKNIAVSSAKGEKGETIKINITATEQLTIENDGLLLEYDHTKLKCTRASSGTVKDLMISAADRNKEGVVIALVATSIESVKVEKGTILATVEFEVLEEKASETTLKLVHEEEVNHPQLATGKVTITEVTEKEPTQTTEPEQTTNPEQSKEPEQKEEVVEKEIPSKAPSTNVGPKTGDIPVVGYAIIMSVAILGVVCIVVARIKNKK